MVLRGEGTTLNHVVEGEIDLSDVEQTLDALSSVRSRIYKCPLLIPGITALFDKNTAEASVSIAGTVYALPMRKGTLGPDVVDISALYP